MRMRREMKRGFAENEEHLRLRVERIVTSSAVRSSAIAVRPSRDGSLICEREVEGWKRYVSIKTLADDPAWGGANEAEQGYWLTWGEWPVPAGASEGPDRRGFDSHKVGSLNLVQRLIVHW